MNHEVGVWCVRVCAYYARIIREYLLEGVTFPRGNVWGFDTHDTGSRTMSSAEKNKKIK